MAEVSVKPIEPVGEGASVVGLVDDQGSAWNHLEHLAHETLLLGAVHLLSALVVAGLHEVVHIADGCSHRGHEMAAGYFGALVFGRLLVEGEEIDEREDPGDESQRPLPGKTIDLAMGIGGNGRQAEGGYGDEEQFGATKDAIGVAVPESREERSQGVGRIAASAQAVHGEHVQSGKAQPESSLSHERNEPCSAS